MQIAIGLYEGYTALDAIGPFAVFTNLPDAEVVVCGARAGRCSDESGLLHLDLERSFDDVDRPDVVCVPGGLITRRLARDGAPIVDWLRRVHPATTYTTSVCTGALLLGAAGILDGRRATTHWIALDQLRAYGAVPTDDRVVVDGPVVTAAGVSAGIDLALTVVTELAGPETAQAIQLGIEYDPQPPHNSGSPRAATPAVRDLVTRVMRDAEARIHAAP
jgi:transcriptional regulator GlxA family with amidase domain